MPQTVRIAVLECDTPFDKVKAVRGEYGDIFRDLLLRGLGHHEDQAQLPDVDLQISQWDVVNNYQTYPEPGSFDALLITGSRHTVFHDDPWIHTLVAYVQRINSQTDKPIVGICFGHQIIARALGGKVGVCPGGWEISVDEVRLNELGQKLVGVPVLSLHQMHRDAVLSCPEGLESLGSSPACEIQGLYKPGRVLSFQAHPEFDGFIMENIVKARHEQGVFDETLADRGLQRAQDEHDGVRVAGFIWRFLLGVEAR